MALFSSNSTPTVALAEIADVVDVESASVTLYSHRSDPISHRIRFVLGEKEIYAMLKYCTDDMPSEDLLDVNPRGDLPTLVDRELVLYRVSVVSTYLDERFPHPPLMPMDPVSRARERMLLASVEQDCYSLIPLIEGDDEKKSMQAKTQLRENLTAITELFAETEFACSNEFTMIDTAIAPILWRLSHYGIKLPKSALPILRYAQRVFMRESFSRSLTEEERNML